MNGLPLGVPDPSGWRPSRWVFVLFAAGALVLIPWAGLLAAELPSTHEAAHWDIAWIGFDVMLALLLLTVAVTAQRRSRWLEGAATASATLLFSDAWFDVLTASTRVELAVALIEALCVELPLAIFCLLLARSAEHHLYVGDAYAASPSSSSPSRARISSRSPSSSP